MKTSSYIPCHTERSRSVKPGTRNLKLLAPLILISCLIVFVTSCNEDEPPTIPTVSTLAATDITPTTAIVHGEITNDGNANITESGFVYSTIIGEPTTADTKVVVEADDDMLELLLEDLNSSTTYHVRAYATNSKGTAYGETVDVATGNAAPTVTDVTVTGNTGVGSRLTGTYTYVDTDNDAEGATTLQWYAADNGAGLNEAAIAGAMEEDYIIEEEYFGKYLRFGVTPKAATGNTTAGEEIKSSFTNDIGGQTEVAFTYNGEDVTYGIITSSVTGEKWLDRNLGASNSPSSVDDFVNWGDLFQWGRRADGHQVVTYTGLTQDDVSGVSVSGTIDPNAPGWVDTDTPPHSNFILVSSFFTVNRPQDWRKPQNNDLWQGVNGTNNPCPSGWRIPTKEEFEAETLTTMEEAYAQLKLTYGHYRNPNGVFDGNSAGFYWTSTVFTNPSTGLFYSYRLTFDSSFSFVTGQRSQGVPCRCIKD